MTQSTWGISSPLDATSVASSTDRDLDLNLFRAPRRLFCTAKEGRSRSHHSIHQKEKGKTFTSLKAPFDKCLCANLHTTHIIHKVIFAVMPQNQKEGWHPAKRDQSWSTFTLIHEWKNVFLVYKNSISEGAKSSIQTLKGTAAWFESRFDCRLLMVNCRPWQWLPDVSKWYKKYTNLHVKLIKHDFSMCCKCDHKPNCLQGFIVWVGNADGAADTIMNANVSG